jgi:putative ABC transport system permease protein
VLPFTNQNNFPAQRDGHPEQSIGGMEIRSVTPDYFETMGIPIVRGRAVGAEDRASAAPVILVSESVARAWWSSASPIGDRVDIGRFRGRILSDDPPREVIGVVADTKARTLRDGPRTTVYVPLQQWPSQAMSWVVRGNVTAAEIRQAVRSIDPRQRVDRILSMDALVARTAADSRFDAWISGSFAAAAVALTLIGLYGLLSFSVTSRQSEIGIRMAVGATPHQVQRLILREGGMLIGWGTAIGLAGAYYASRLLAALLFGTQVTDWPSYAIAGAALLLTGLLACVIPARRAARLDPHAALRSDG